MRSLFPLSALLVPALLLAACADDGMTRPFSTSRNSAPETTTSTQVPLSTPPSFAIRPTRGGALPGGRDGGPAGDQAAGSRGQDALLQAAGPAAESDIRAVINENSGLIYPGPAFVDQLMSWSPPPGYAPVINPPTTSGGSWFSRIF
ncbi:MAG: hypothetical protein WDN25_19055 [Acetobacteraceae bacterium]